jgi:hypothetical protein
MRGGSHAEPTRRRADSPCMVNQAKQDSRPRSGSKEYPRTLKSMYAAFVQVIKFVQVQPMNI